jgi:hypothetical protein
MDEIELQLAGHAHDEFYAGIEDGHLQIFRAKRNRKGKVIAIVTRPSAIVLELVLVLDMSEEARCSHRPFGSLDSPVLKFEHFSAVSLQDRGRGRGRGRGRSQKECGVRLNGLDTAVGAELRRSIPINRGSATANTGLEACGDQDE